MLIDEMHYPMLVNMRYTDKDFLGNLMHLNQIYMIANFSCNATARWEKVLPGPTTLSFDRNTTFEHLPQADFPEHYFQFVAYNQLRTRIPNTNVLADFIGCIDRLEDPVVMGDVNRNQLVRRTIDLTNLNGNTLQVTLWNELATAFDAETYDTMEKPVILAVSSCRPKVFRDTGKYFWHTHHLRSTGKDQVTWPSNGFVTVSGIHMRPLSSKSPVTEIGSTRVVMIAH
ncbi:replication protein A 70 kDa DNA-binding subunit B-like isoform X2 [Rutidosis leptorrhynchoides]|uniref:replication protein A 70 kDa DNA-binding subunit B-like isoform X2 n=1 Tax=Rutidosis leptorrhynchoides TaxID=125765 RepID=UPI003A99AA79